MQVVVSMPLKLKGKTQGTCGLGPLNVVQVSSYSRYSGYSGYSVVVVVVVVAIKYIKCKWGKKPQNLFYIFLAF